MRTREDGGIPQRVASQGRAHPLCVGQLSSPPPLSPASAEAFLLLVEGQEPTTCGWSKQCSATDVGGPVVYNAALERSATVNTTVPSIW